MKKTSDWILNNKIIIPILIIIFVLLCVVNLRSLVDSNLLVLKLNILYLISVLTKAVPLVVAFLLIYIWRKFATKWVIKIEKLDIGGASIIFEKPEELFKQQIKNFMNTKRTLFYFDPQRDNIADTISSYYETYKVIREKINIYDTATSQQSKYYNAANNMIQTLNEFLTSYQSNYRRWFDNRMEKPNEADYSKCISEIQKEYWNYDNMIAGFINLNNEFLDYAKEFDINTNKWAAAQKQL